MKLYGSVNSPYVRKARILLGELGLTDQVELIFAEGTPFDDPGLRAKNPLRKIPFLETGDGGLYYDSRTVNEALLQAAEPAAAARMLPAGGAERLRALTRQSLGDGLCDAALTVSYERRLRPETLHWPDWLDMQWGKVTSALDAMEADAPPEGRFDLGDCAWTAALVYVDFRFPDRPWRDHRPKLAAWFETAKARPSVAAAM